MLSNTLKCWCQDVTASAINHLSDNCMLSSRHGNRSPSFSILHTLSHRPLLVGLLPLSLSTLLGLLLLPGVWGGAMMDFMGSGELSVSVASSLARMPLRMCRGVWLMGAQMYA